MNLTLSRIRTLKIQCELLISKMALGVNIDIKLSKLASQAEKIINNEIGEDLKITHKYIDKIIDGYRLKYKDQDPTPEFDNLLRIDVEADEDYKKHSKELNGLWNKSVEVDFPAIIYKPINTYYERIVNQEEQVTYGDLIFQINPYKALLNLVVEGFLIEEE